MKKNFRFLMTFLMLLGLGFSQWAWAGTYYCDTKNVTWWDNSYAYFFGGTGDAVKVQMTSVSGTISSCQYSGDHTKVLFYRASSIDASWWNQTVDITISSYNFWELSSSTEGTDPAKQKIQSSSRYSPNGAILGIGDWSANTHPLTDGTVTINLAAATTYSFKVLKGSSYYGNNGTMTTDNCTDWTMSNASDINNCKITTLGAGDYIFVYNSSSTKLTVYYPYFVSSHGNTGLGGLNSSPGVNQFTCNNGIYSRVCSNTSAGAKGYRISRKTGWGDWGYEGNIVIDNENSNVNVTLDGQNKAFTVAKLSNITIYFNPSTMKTWVKAEPYYKITYNVNGGEGTAPTDTSSCKVAYSTVQSCSKTMKRTGYVFTGWNTNAAGTGTHYNVGAKPTLSTANLNLFAEWKDASQATKITVYYYNTTNWNGVNCHAYGGNLPATTWPGFAATKTDTTHDGYDVYRVSFYEGEYATLKFSNASNSSNQTGACTNVASHNGGCIFFQNSTTSWGTLPTQNYKITFGYGSNGTGVSAKVDGAAISSNSYVDKDKTITFTATAATGYQLKEWNTKQDGTGTQLSTDATYTPTATANMTVYAIFKPIAYTITYDNLQGASNTGNPTTYTIESGLITFVAPGTRTGYDFDAWDPATIEAGSTGNQTTTAIWTAKSYNITYRDKDDAAFSGSNESSLPNKHTYGTATALASGAKTGFNFDGWYTDAACSMGPISTLGATDYTSNITLYAKWTASEVYYSITKGVNDANMGSISSDPAASSVLSGTNVTFTATPNTGYEVEGWYYNAACSGTAAQVGGNTHNVAINSDMTVYVKFKYIDYTVTKEAKAPVTLGFSLGEITTSQDLTKVHHGVSFSITATPTVLSRFMGWTSSDNTKVIFENANSATTTVTVTANNVTIYANFDGRYVLRGGLVGESGDGGMPGYENNTPIYGTSWGEVRYNLQANKKYGFYLIDKSDSDQGYGLQNDGSIDLDAAWHDFYKDKLAYITTRGAGSYRFEICVGSTGRPVYPRIQVKGSNTQPLSLQMTFGKNGEGSVSATAKHGDAAAVAFTTGQYVATGDNVVFTAAPNSGYAVDGWYTNAACTEGKHDEGSATYTINNIQAAQTVYVKFKTATYTITYKDQGDAAFSGAHETGSPTTHTYGAVTALKSATKTGYSFAGWYTSSDCSTGLVTSLGATDYTSNITLYAKWTPAQYTITYKDENDETYSGSNLSSLPATHTYGTATDLVDGVRDGYQFNGWYESSDCSGSAVTSIGATAKTDDFTLYAKWTKYAPNGAIIGSWNSWNPATDKLTDGSVTINLTASKTPYEFKVIYGTSYYGNSGTMYRNNCTGWTMETDANCKIVADKTGDYVFTWNNSTHHLSVTYATSPTRTIYLDLSSFASWEVDTHTFTVGDYNGADKLMTKVTDCANSHLYSADVGTIDIPYVFKRMRDDLGSTWDTASVAVISPNNACKITGWHAGSASTTTLSYSVTYDMKGHGTQIDPTCVQSGNTFAAPTDPTATGWEFGGWYKETDLTNAWNFSTDVVTEPTTLYAKWTEAAGYTVDTACVKPAGCSPRIGTITTSQDLSKVYDGVPFSITANPTVLSRFMGWTSSDNTKVTFENANSATTNVTVTGNVTIYANFDGRYVLRGGLVGESGSGGMPGYENTTAIYGTTWGDVRYNLEANKKYGFYLVDKLDSDKSYGLKNDGSINLDNVYFSDFYADKMAYITTRGAGSYQFQLCVGSTDRPTYPRMKVLATEIQPLSLQMTFGKNGEGSISATAQHGSAAAVAITTGQWVATGDNVVFTATPSTGYNVEGWYTNSACTEGKHDAGETTYTINNIQAAQTTVYVKFAPKQTAVTIYKNDGSDPEVTASLTATYNSNAFSTPASSWTRTGYTLDNFWLARTGGQRISTNNNSFVLGVGGYTDSNRRWINESATMDWFAHWKANIYTITLDKNGGAANGSAQVPYDSAAIRVGATHCSRDYYTLSGYYSAATDGVKVLNADGTFADATVSGYITNSKWTKAENCTLYAQWTPIEYNITYNNLQGATNEGNPATYNVESGLITFVNPGTRTGYNFGAWDPASIAAGSHGDQATTASWTAQTYTISYKDKDGADYSGSNIGALPTTHTYGAETNLVNGAKAGYSFDGWFEDAACATAPVSTIGATAKTDNFTLYAKWTQTLVYYAITKGVNDVNMGSVSSNAEQEDHVLGGTVVTFTAAPNAGYEVEGWYTNAECTEGKSDAGLLQHNVTIDANKTVYVKFKYIDYTVTKVANKPAECSKTIGSIITSQDLTKVHHGVSFQITARPSVLSRFMGWTSSDNSKVTFANVNDTVTTVTVTGNNVTIYANFDGRYAMRGGYKDKEGTGGMPGLSNTTPIYGTTWGDVRYTLEANTAYAFRLVDLADSEQNYGMPAASGIAGTINLDNDYFTTFVAGNITYLTTRGAGSYQFQLCATNEAPFYPRMKVVATGTQPLSLQIPYGVNDAVMGSISATANGVAFDKNKWVATGNNVVFTAAPNSGYEVEGWYGNSGCTGTKLQTGGTTYTINNIQAAQTVYVKYKAIAYTITYKDQNDEAFSGAHELGYPTTHTYGKATTLKKATKKAYVFEGWYTDAACSVGYVTKLDANAYTSNITLYAKWRTANTVKIYYYNMYDWANVRCHGYGGTLGSMDWPGVDATLETLTRDGHSVWSYSFYEGEYEKFKFNDKANDKHQTGLYTNATANDGRCAYFDKAHTPDTVWWGKLPIQNYLVTFDANGHGTAPAAVWVDKDSTVAAPADPANPTGYTFSGWYKEAGCTNEWDFDYDTIKATTTIFAKWTPVQYTITYNTNGGVEVPQGSYTIETATFSLPTATKTGSVFDGWFDNAELTGTAVTEITLGSYGDKEFWAKWLSANVYLEGRARVKTGENTYTKVSDSGSEWATDSKTIQFTYNTTDSVYYLNLNQTVGEVEAYIVGDQHHYFRVGLADGNGPVTCLGVTNVENDYEYTTGNKSATLLANANKSAWFNPANVNAPNVLAGPVMLKYDPKNLQLAYCAPLLTIAYTGDLQTMKDFTITFADASVTSDGLSDSTITRQYKLGDGEWTTWSSDIVAQQGTYKLRAIASGKNEFGQDVEVVSKEIAITVTKPAITAQVTHVNDVATANPIVRVNDNFTITPTVTGVPDAQTVQVCYKWISIPAGSSIDMSKNIFTRVGETSAAKVAIDVAGDYTIRVYVTSSNECPDLGIKWDSTDVNVHVKGDEITVYAKVDKGITDWANKYIYYWKNAAGTWPGYEMTYIGKDSVDYEWYSYNIVGYKAYQGGNLLFNDGTEQYGQYQTNNVAMPVDNEFYFIKTAIDGGKRNVATDPHIDVTRRVILMTDTTALYQYVTIKVEGKGIFFANREDMTYTYTLTSKPDGSTATLNQKHQLMPDKAGNYVVTIRCEAGSLNAENSFVLRVQPNPVTLTASAGASANIGATTTLTVASSQSIGGLYKTFTVIEPGTNDPITFQSGTTSTTSNSYSLLSSGTYTFAVVLTDGEGMIAGKAQCSLTVNPKSYYIKHPFDGSNWSWHELTYSEADGVYRYPAPGSSEVAKYVAGNGADINNAASDEGKKYHSTILNPDNLTGTTEALFTYDVTTDEVTVYALNKRLYRIKSICGDNTYYSNAMTNDGDAISFFAEKGGQLVWQERATAAAEWEDQSVEVTTTATESGIYTATPTIKAASFTLTAYTGTLTVFSQLTKDAMSTGTPTAANGQLTEFTKSNAAEYYNHYWVRYISTNNAQAMATVGNNINNCLAITLPYYEMPALGNVRYAYDNTTNHFSRTFIAGASDQNFLRVYGENLDTLVTGSDPKEYKPISSLESSKKFDDGSDWIYMASASGNVNATQSVTARLVTKYNNTQRWILAESGLEADEDAKRVVLNQDVATPGRYNLTLIYDFKTNRLTAGAQPEPGTVITDTMLVDQLILTRENDGDATQFTLADNAKLIVVDKMTVELDVTKSMWTAWEDNTTGGGYKIMYFWFSIPYQCRISDIYGLGKYTEKFEIQRYRGDLRAAGTAGSATGVTAWRRLKVTATMEANRGYVVAMKLQESDFKDATVGGEKKSVIRLFFPSIGKVELAHEVTTVLAEYVDSAKTSNLHWNWNIMGNPLVTSGDGDLLIDTEHEGAAELNYIYVWQWNGGARTYEPWALEDTELKSTHSYMVQAKGTVYWKYPSDDPTPARYLEAAHYASEDSYGKLNLRLNIKQDDQLLDKTYIRYREDGSREEYEMGRDLEKIINSGVTQMYATADNNLAAICLSSEDKEMIPLTVIASNNGTYAISLHRQFNSNLEPTIYDAETGTYTNLSLSNFNVVLTKGTYENRFFFLLKKTGVVTNKDELNSNNFGDGVQKIIMNEKLYIIRDGIMYDARGCNVK